MTAKLPLWAERLAVFDTETTGISPEHSRVVSATVALLGANGEVLERYDWLLDPGVDIPASAAEIHGITTEVARANGTDAAEVLPWISTVATTLSILMSRRLAVACKIRIFA